MDPRGGKAQGGEMAMGGGDMGDGMGMMAPPRSSGMMPGGGRMMMPMHMTFFWGSRVQILFSGWPGDRGIGMYFLALLLVLASSALLESLSSLSRRLSRPRTASATTALLLTAVHAARMGLSYLVMLAVMSFNVGVLIAAVAGHAIGFLLCRSWIFTTGSRPNNQDALPSTKY